MDCSHPAVAFLSRVLAERNQILDALRADRHDPELRAARADWVEGFEPESAASRLVDQLFRSGGGETQTLFDAAVKAAFDAGQSGLIDGLQGVRAAREAMLGEALTDDCAAPIAELNRAVIRLTDLIACLPETMEAERRRRHKRRGRKPATDADKTADAKLARDWAAARTQYTAKKDFAKAKGLTVKDLSRVLSRVRKRKSRADK